LTDPGSGVLVTAPERSRRRWRLDRYLPVFMLAPAVVVLAALTLFPIGYVIWLSLTDYGVNSASPNGTFIGLDNYRLIKDDPMFWDSVRITGLFTAGAVISEFVLGFALAALLNRKLRGLGLVRRSCCCRCP
jgi:multiple sugar transport system permease protein